MLQILQTENKPAYLYAAIGGTFNIENAKELFDKILTMCFEHGCSGILLDVRKIEGNLSILDRFEIWRYLAEKRIFDFSVCCVGTGRHLVPDRFLETVARNRGVHVKVTADMDEADQWLRMQYRDRQSAPHKTIVPR